MKYKEKDPIISVEQWFPDKPLDYVIEAKGKKQTCIQYHTYGYSNPTLKDRFSVITSSSIDHRYEDTKVYLVEHLEDGFIKFVYKLGLADVGSGTQDWKLAMLSPSDWILTYKSGRREVLTDREFKERFE